jgi:hypothetical protein
LLDYLISVYNLVKHLNVLLEFSLKFKIVVKYLSNIFFVIFVVYTLSQVGSNLFSDGSLYKTIYKCGVVVVIYVSAVKLKVEIKLEDLFLKRSLISIVKVRPSNSVTTSLGFFRGVY